MQETDRLLRFEEVSQTTGLKRTAIYKGVKAGNFPRPVPVTAKAVRWLESEIRAWQAARVAERDTAPAT
jgi:prophage regulatory protein